MTPGLTKKEIRKAGRHEGQMTIEYAVMFSVIVAVIIYAATQVVRPSVNRFFGATEGVFDNATDTVTERF